MTHSREPRSGKLDPHDEELHQKEQEARRRFEQEITQKQVRLKRARARGDRGIWFGLGMIGLVGWSIAVPVVVGALIGVWLDQRFGGGVRWTLGLIFLGLVMGANNVWQWMEKERRREEEEA